MFHSSEKSPEFNLKNVVLLILPYDVHNINSWFCPENTFSVLEVSVHEDYLSTYQATDICILCFLSCPRVAATTAKVVVVPLILLIIKQHNSSCRSTSDHL